MVALNVSTELADTIQTEATTRGLTVEEYLRSAIKRERSLAARKKIEREQAWWFTLPENKRAKYKGEYVAIHDLAVVDHDKNESILYKRVREQYGKTSVLVIPAEGVREIKIYSPRLAR
jgi:hypothetical protein